MKTIWKQKLMTGCGEQTYRLPFGVEVLKLDMSGGVPCVWFMVDPDAEPTDFTFVTIGTGHEIPTNVLDNMRHIGTYQTLDMESNVFVGHVFLTWDY